MNKLPETINDLNNRIKALDKRIDGLEESARILKSNGYDILSYLESLKEQRSKLQKDFDTMNLQ